MTKLNEFKTGKVQLLCTNNQQKKILKNNQKIILKTSFVPWSNKSNFKTILIYNLAASK